MQFLNSVWFFALAAISIPVIIHLWNIRPGKTLKVGSIALITEASKSTSRSLKLLDILLLIVRCLLLAVLAILLATPVWQKYVSAQKAKGWMLIPKENFKETYQKFKTTVDSLNKAGYEFHYFNSGFVKQDLNALLADSTRKDTAATTNYWSLIKQLERSAPNAPVYLFTQNGIDHFKGTKPPVQFNALTWQTYTTKDSVDKWIQQAFMANNGTIKVITGNSNPSSTYFTSQTIQANGNADITISVQNGQPLVSLKKDGRAVAVDTSAMQMAIYTDKHRVDAGYLRAAVSAAAAFIGRKYVVKLYTSAAQIPGRQTWLFWLSEQAVPQSLSSKSQNIFKYQAGKVVDVNSWINPGHISLAKVVVATSDGTAVWRDGFGKPVLTANGHVYKFYSRFNPLWGNLVWGDDFPKLILKLLIAGKESQPKGHERRILSNRQLQPGVFAHSMPQQSPETKQQADLSKYFWLLLALLFIGERVLSHQKTKTNG